MPKQPTTTDKPDMAIKKQPRDLAQKLQSMPKVADYFANPGEGVKTFINKHTVNVRSDIDGNEGANKAERIKKDKTQSARLDAQFGKDIQVAERVLTPGETAEKERLVKKMKPVEKWQQRYGKKRGEEVMYATATKMAKEETELDEGVRVDHDRYERSHKKTASGTGYWMFTNKPHGPVKDYDDETKVHRYSGKFSDAKKSAIEWAKKHGHHTAYVMEETELDEGAADDFHNKWWRKRDKARSAAQINTPNRSKEESDARTEKLKREQEKLQQRYGGVQKEETYYVIHKKSRTPGEVSSRAGENIAGVTIKDKYHDRKEASAHAKHIDKQSLFRNVHGSKLGHGVGKWVNGELQEEVDEVDEGNKYNKLLKNMHARKVGATRMRDHGSPELNRIAALKKGRELMKNSYEPEGEELDEDSHRDHFTFLRHLQKANIPIAARPSKEEALQLVHRHGDANRAGEVYVRRYQKIKNAARKVQKEEVEIKEQVLLELGEPMSAAPATSDNPGGAGLNAGPQANNNDSSDKDDDDDTNDENDDVKQAKTYLESIALSSAKLYEDIQDDADIPDWILEKLSLSEKFLKSIEGELGDNQGNSKDEEGDNDEEADPNEKPSAFSGGKAAMAKESFDLDEARQKKSPWAKLETRLKSGGYDAKEVLSRPAPGDAEKRAKLAQSLAGLKK
jgi:hypothetical protein